MSPCDRTPTDPFRCSRLQNCLASFRQAQPPRRLARAAVGKGCGRLSQNLNVQTWSLMNDSGFRMIQGSEKRRPLGANSLSPTSTASAKCRSSWNVSRSANSISKTEGRLPHNSVANPNEWLVTHDPWVPTAKPKNDSSLNVRSKSDRRLITNNPFSGCNRKQKQCWNTGNEA